MNDNEMGSAAGQIESWLEDQKCLKKVEDMLNLAYDILPHWPSVFRYTRGERIMALLLGMEELCVAAHLKHFKRTTMQELDIKNHQLQLALLGARRKAYTDKSGRQKTLLSSGGYEQWAKLSVEAGKLIGRWKASLSQNDNEK